MKARVILTDLTALLRPGVHADPDTLQGAEGEVTNTAERDNSPLRDVVRPPKSPVWYQLSEDQFD